MRGALIVIEGIDRIGKSTQAIKLVESLSSSKHGTHSVQLIKFPDRLTSIGQLIGEYLKGHKQMDDHVIHLLFSANRWECVSRMRSLLRMGTTLIVDRYAYSGVAYSAAKPNLNLEWCRSADIGLPLPDCVLFLTDPNNVNFNRNGFGDEIYEFRDFQIKVNQNFQKLYDDNWKSVLELGIFNVYEFGITDMLAIDEQMNFLLQTRFTDDREYVAIIRYNLFQTRDYIISANKDIDTLHNELLEIVKETIEKVKNTNEESMKLLWDQTN